MNNSPYSNKRAEARKKARERGEQTTQRNWDNYSVGGAPSVGEKSQTQQQSGASDISKIVNDAIASLRQEIISEVTQNVISKLRSENPNQNENKERNKTPDTPFDPLTAPMFNYQIGAPNNGPRSAIIAEIPFKPNKLHVLGLEGESLKWVETEDC